MANIDGGCPERALQHKGYSDFVQHTNPLKEGLLRLVLNEPQTLQVTIGYLQNQAANMPLVYNSLISLNSVTKPELDNSLIQLNSVDSTESANSSIMSKTCIAGTSPNVLMKSDANHFPSRDETQKAQKEKGSVRSAALWDDCSFNHEENHYSTDLDNNADLRHEKNQQLSHPSLGGEHILTTIGGWDLHLHGTLSHAQTLHTEIIGTQNLQVVKSYSQNNPEIIGAVHSSNDISSVYPFGSSLGFLRCSDLSFRPQASRTHAEKLALGFSNFSSSTLASISSISSCGKRICFLADFWFMSPVATVNTPLLMIRVGTPYIKKNGKKSIDVGSHQDVRWVHTLTISWCSNCDAPECGNTSEASIHNVTRTYIMACLHDTKTRPNFTYLFLGTPSDLPTCTPTVLRAEADSEAEARAKFIDWDLTFAAQIRTAAPSRLQLFSTDDGFMWIYEQRQEASHA